MKLISYIKAGKPLMDKMGIKNVLLFTDSASVIQEAYTCYHDYPDLCGKLKFFYLKKKRFEVSTININTFIRLSNFLYHHVMYTYMLI